MAVLCVVGLRGIGAVGEEARELDSVSVKKVAGTSRDHTQFRRRGSPERSEIGYTEAVAGLNQVAKDLEHIANRFKTAR